MRKKILKLSLILTQIVLLIGCQFSDLKTFSSDNYSFQYPRTYLIEENTELPYVLVIKGEKGRVEIFKDSDFINEPGYGVMGHRFFWHSSSGQEEFESKSVPKDQIKIGDYDVWTFYMKDDEETKNEIKKITNSIKTK